MKIRLKRKVKIGLTIITLVLLVIIYSLIEPHWIKIRIIQFSSNQIPVQFNNKKVVFVSDIHHGPYFSIDRVAKLVDKINSLEPDMIILGGDYVHREPKYIEPVFKELSRLKSKSGIFAVFGNHDYWEDPIRIQACMKTAKIRNIENNSFWVKQNQDSIKIGGVGDLWENSQIIDNTINDVNGSDFCILVSHNPDYCEQITTDKVDLVLSGHTHGGQVSLFGFWSPILPSGFGQKYCYGLKKMNNFSIYITSGIGTITPPMRFFVRPEIVVINLIRSN
jgi:uncharacterized protein